MKKILLLPFLQMPSGHHQTADAIGAYLKDIDVSLEINKVDIFHYSYRLIEHAASRLYLKAIKLLPDFYKWLYRQNACGGYQADQRYIFYELLFLKKMKNLIKEENPDIVICTHCLPSYLLNLLKKRNHLAIPVINAYTDYFINTVWGMDLVDLHLVPSETLKSILQQKGVSKEKIAVTGIPVHPQIAKKRKKRNHFPYHVLVSGGNLGVGSIEKIFRDYPISGKIKFFVLCGTNQKLLRKIEQLQSSFVVPIAYISDRAKMNALYEQMDLMVTKPGGITVGECLQKEIPLFLLDALPGPEERNHQFLLKEKLAQRMNLNELEKSLLLFLENEEERNLHQQRLSFYNDGLEDIRFVLTNFLNKTKAKKEGLF